MSHGSVMERSKLTYAKHLEFFFFEYQIFNKDSYYQHYHQTLSCSMAIITTPKTKLNCTLRNHTTEFHRVETGSQKPWAITTYPHSYFPKYPNAQNPQATGMGLMGVLSVQLWSSVCLRVSALFGIFYSVQSMCLKQSLSMD